MPLSSRACPLDKMLGRFVEISDDACLEERMTLGRAHLLEFSSSHDVSGHDVIVHLGTDRPTSTLLSD